MHMTGGDWFITFNHAMKNKVKFADDTTLVAEGIGEVSIERRDGRHSLIKNVLYIPEINCILLSLFQLLENGYKIHMENKVLHLMVENRVFILKALMTLNRTFKVELKVMVHGCLSIAVSREEWIWNYRLGNINFQDPMPCKIMKW